MTRRIEISLLLVLLATAGFAQDFELLPAEAGDLDAVHAALGATEVGTLPANAPETERAPLFYSRALDVGARLDLRPAPHRARSRSYSFDVRGSELVAGVEVYTLGPGALLRVHAVPPSDWHDEVALDPASLTLVSPAGESFEGGSGMELLAGAEKLRAANAPFPAGTSAFTLRPELGAGTFLLRADRIATPDARFRIQIFDVGSDLELALATDAMSYLQGQPMVVTAALEGSATPDVVSVEGRVGPGTEPSGTLAFGVERNGRYVARSMASAPSDRRSSLQEAAVRVAGRLGELHFVRDVRVPFGVAMPTARFAGDAGVSRSDSLSVRLGIEAVAEGRYEARAVLYGTDASGALRPAGIAHSAAWLAAGRGELELRFDRETLGGLTPPLELRDLQLNDQGRMAMLHRQARALVIGE